MATARALRSRYEVEVLIERDLPVAIFDRGQRTIPAGEWENEQPIAVTTRSLDADRDGAPEEVRYHDQKSGVILRRENDRDYDGTIRRRLRRLLLKRHRRNPRRLSRTQRWPNAYFAEHGFMSLNDAHVRFVQSIGTY